MALCMQDMAVSRLKDIDVRTFNQIQERKSIDAFRYKKRQYIVKGLMGTQMNYLNNLRYNIIQKNTELTLKDGFFYRGQWYTNSTAKVPQKVMQASSIHESLLPEIQELEKQLREFNADKVSFNQGIGLLLGKCFNPQDIRDALPEVLVPLMDSPEHLLDRTRPELYTLTSDLHIKQFEKVKEKIYFYLATALLG